MDADVIRKKLARQKMLTAIQELSEVMEQIPTAEDLQLIEEEAVLSQIIPEDDSEESDLARLNDLAEQHGLTLEKMDHTYLIDGFAANGLPQALGYAEGVDRANQFTPPTGEEIALWIPGADYGHQATSPRLHRLAKQHGLPFKKIGNTYKFLDVNAHGLDQAIGYAEGFDRARLDHH